MKLTSLLKYLRNACLAASLLFGSQAAHAGVPVIDGAHIGKQAAEFIETARRYGEQVKKWQEELQQYQEKFQQATSGQFSGLLDAFGIDTTGLEILENAQRKAAHRKFVSDMRTNSRCLRMSSSSQGLAKSLCEARLELEVAKLKNIIEVMDYTDAQNLLIKKTLREAKKLDGAKDAKAKEVKLAEVAALQNNLRDTVVEKSKTFGQYDQQINALKAQQGEVARVAMQGKPPGLLGGIASAAIMKGVFKGIQHEIPK